MQRRKRALRWIIGLFFATLLVLTFLSNTIQSMSLPKVSVEKPRSGGLPLDVSGDGFLQPAHTAQLFAEGDWEVGQILASKDERVKKGDPLITFDTASTERTLQDEQDRYEQLQLQLAKMAEQMKPLVRNEDSDGIANLKRDIASQQIDIKVQQRKIADLQKQIDEGGTLTSPVDGVVTAINASEGTTASRGQPVIEIADDQLGYQFSVVADSDDASALRIGDKVNVQLDETPNRSIDGTISDIEDAAAGGSSGDSDGSDKKITFDVKDSKLQPGSKASVNIVNQSRSFGMQIPKSVLQQDNSGYYVFTVSEKDGPLGAAYYVSKTYIKILDENGDTIVTGDLRPDDQYVTESSETISDGDRVRY